MPMTSECSLFSEYRAFARLNFFSGVRRSRSGLRLITTCLLRPQFAISQLLIPVSPDTPFSSCDLVPIVLPTLHRMPDDLLQAHRLATPRQPIILVDFVSKAHLRTRVPDKLPTD